MYSSFRVLISTFKIRNSLLSVSATPRKEHSTGHDGHTECRVLSLGSKRPDQITAGSFQIVTSEYRSNRSYEHRCGLSSFYLLKVRESPLLFIQGLGYKGPDFIGGGGNSETSV